MIEALTLERFPGIGPQRFRALVDHFGSPAAALDANPSEFAAVVRSGRTRPGGGSANGRRRTWAADDPAARNRAGREARAIRRRCLADGITVLVYGGRGYPDPLNVLTDPPPVLFVLGDADLLRRPCVSIVGSRRATAYGRRIARGLGAHLASRGHCVVSGMAMGIDAEAHRGALPGPTAAVLGSGVDVVSPPRNRALYGRIREHGVVVSEFAPGVGAAAHHFPRRNRIIAALANDVIIVEASHRSGALITAEIALDLGREVHAVPGPIDRPTSQGTNRLIADGAGVILEVGSGNALYANPTLPDEPELRELLVALPEAPVTIDEVAALAGRLPDEIAPVLTILEIRGYLTPTRDGRVMKTPGRGTAMVREGAA